MTRLSDALLLAELLAECEYDWIEFNLLCTQVTINPVAYNRPVWIDDKDQVRVGIESQELAIIPQSLASHHHSCDVYGRPSASIAFAACLFFASGIHLCRERNPVGGACPIPKLRKVTDANTQAG